MGPRDSMRAHCKILLAATKRDRPAERSPRDSGSLVFAFCMTLADGAVFGATARVAAIAQNPQEALRAGSIYRDRCPQRFAAFEKLIIREVGRARRC